MKENILDIRQVQCKAHKTLHQATVEREGTWVDFKLEPAWLFSQKIDRGRQIWVLA